MTSILFTWVHYTNTANIPRADGAKRRARVLIPHGYLHPGVWEHSEVQSCPPLCDGRSSMLCACASTSSLHARTKKMFFILLLSPVLKLFRLKLGQSLIRVENLLYKIIQSCLRRRLAKMYFAVLQYIFAMYFAFNWKQACSFMN
jgi:hypothetical protein